MKLKIFAFYFILLCFNMSWAFGEAYQDKALNQNPLKIEKVEMKHPRLQPGGVSELVIHMQLDDEYRAYLDQFKLNVVEPNNVFLTEFHVKPLIKFFDPLTKKEKTGTEGKAELQTLVQLPSNISAGSKQVKVDLFYQACTDKFCLFPQKVPVEFQFNVTGGSEALFAKTLDKGWLYALFIVFLAGILTSLTPCIFPLIPITLAVIGSNQSGTSKLKGALVSLSYVLGIALTYSLLGVAAAKTGALFGALLGHPVVVAIIALLFVIMGLSMYGLFEIRLPAFISNKIAGTKTEKGLIGAFLSGLIAGVVASPCVGPVLVSVLAYVAQTQDALKGFILLFVFAFGLGQLFLVLGTFSSLLQRLPKSGPWMENIKFIFGTTMIAMALFYVYPVSHSALFDGLVAMALILIASFFGAFDRLNKLNDSGRLRKALMLLVFMSGWVFAIKALVPEHIEEKLFPHLNTGLPTYPHPDWYSYSEATLMKAKEDGRPVILDFKAEWCLACKELEAYTFSDEKVLTKGQDFLWLEFDATNPSAELDELKTRYDIKGLPQVLFFDRHGKWRTDLTLTGFTDAEDFLMRMDKAQK